MRFMQLILGTYVAIIALFVFANYLQIATSPPRGGRLLPWHVAVIALSYLIYVVVGVFDAFDIIHNVTRDIVRLVAVGLGAGAMSIIVVHVYKKGNVVTRSRGG